MPNIPQQQTIVQYVANSAQTQYTFAFYAPLPTDIQVYYQAPSAPPIPAVDILALNSQYTVTYNADPTTGGFITLLFTPTTGYYLTINRQVAASLNTNFANAQNFNGANLDAALDRLLLLCQQNQNYNLQRNLSYIINTYLPNATPYTQLPPLPQNYFWIGSGSGVVAAQVSMVPSASVLQSMLANNSPGTDGALLIGYYDTPNTFPTNLDQYLGYKFTSGVDTSVSANTISLTLATSYQFFNGNMLIVRIANANTGATFLGVNGGTGIEVVKYGSTGGYVDLIGGELSIGGLYTFQYDLKNNFWLLINPNPVSAQYFYGSSVYSSTNQAINPSASVRVIFTNINFDDGIFVLASNSFQPSRPGYYRISAEVTMTYGIPGGSGGVAMNLLLNGSFFITLDFPAIYANAILKGQVTLFMNGTTDYVQIQVANGASQVVTVANSGASNYFEIEYIGGA